MNKITLSERICYLILCTIPSSYKEEAIETYLEETKDNYIYEALQYSFGGIVYRWKRLRLGLNIKKDVDSTKVSVCNYVP